MIYPYKSEDMMLTKARSLDNGTMRLAVAFHKRKSIGEMIDRTNLAPHRWVFQTTPEWDDWAENFMNLPGLCPRTWMNDPQWDDWRRHEENAGLYGTDRAKALMNYSKEYGPKRMILTLDTEEQAMHFKLRWQDET